MLHHHDKPVTDSLIAGVLPQLVAAIRGAGDSLAIEVAEGRKVNISHRTQAQQLLMFALADLLVNCLNDHSEDHIYPPLRPYELADMDFCRQWFDEIYDREDAGCDDGDTEPIYTVADIHAKPAPEPAADTVDFNSTVAQQPAPKLASILPMENREWSNDADALVEYAILPLITEKLDELSDRMAQSHAPIHVIDAAKNLTRYDLDTGRKNARRLLWESILAWMQNDPAADGQWVGVIGI